MSDPTFNIKTTAPPLFSSCRLRGAWERQKGEGWAKQAIWGNLPASERRRFGSVENVTSGQFLNFWHQRYARAEGRATPAPAATPDQTPTTAPMTGPAGAEARIPMIGGAAARGAEQSWTGLDPHAPLGDVPGHAA